MTFRNIFSLCTVDDHSNGGEIFSCMNIMGDKTTYFIHDSKIAMCEYHTCLVLSNKNDNSHKQLACSGAILRMGDDLYYYNPLTPFGINFDKMLPLPKSTVDSFSGEYQYYFQNDVRSTFSENIMDINCTNDMRTCLTFTNNSICFGNIENNVIIHSLSSLIYGVIVAFTFGTIMYVLLKKKVIQYPLSFVFTFYIIPLIGLGMMYNGLFLTMAIPYVTGNIIVLALFQFMYYTLRDINIYLHNIKEKDSRRNKY